MDFDILTYGKVVNRLIFALLDPDKSQIDRIEAHEVWFEDSPPVWDF